MRSAGARREPAHAVELELRAYCTQQVSAAGQFDERVCAVERSSAAELYSADRVQAVVVQTHEEDVAGASHCVAHAELHGREELAGREALSQRHERSDRRRGREQLRTPTAYITSLKI